MESVAIGKGRIRVKRTGYVICMYRSRVERRCSYCRGLIGYGETICRIRDRFICSECYEEYKASRLTVIDLIKGSKLVNGGSQ